jgi:isocitrate dehydrogenase
VGTAEFADAVISNLGKTPSQLKPVNYVSGSPMNLKPYVPKPPKVKELLGVDLFLHCTERNPEKLASWVNWLNYGHIELTMITNRGIKVWPEGFSETFCTDHWRCRFKPTSGSKISPSDIIHLLKSALEHGLDVVKTENLYAFDGKAAYSLGQGQ